MKTSDPIANLLSSFSNAIAVGKLEVTIPFSSFKERILTALQAEGIIAGFKKIEDKSKVSLTINLNPKYRSYKRLSKPGRRYYANVSSMPRKYREIVIVSTPKGIMTVKNAVKSNVGGEILMEVS
jgi:small subunit ribosomal protein S8